MKTVRPTLSFGFRWITQVSLSLAIGGCSSPSSDGPDSPDTDDTDPGSTVQPLPCGSSTDTEADAPSQIAFDSAHLQCIQIAMAPGAFAAMASQERFVGVNDGDWNRFVAYAEDCLSTAPNPYQWYPGDVSIDGFFMEDVGIRKKGFLQSVIGPGMSKPSIKLKSDKFRDQYWGDTERLTLNNMAMDPTRMRTCLAYDVFASAGYPAPRCNLANVMVDGSPLGIYTRVESVKKRFLTRAFGTNDGSLYEGSIADFTDGFLKASEAFPNHWEAKTDETDETGGPLFDILEALQVPDDQLASSLSAVLNLEKFIRFWALEVLVAHGDGYTAGRNNFFVYFDPADEKRAVFIPWGADIAFTDAFDTIDRGIGLPPGLGNYTYGELARRLSRLPDVRAQLETTLSTLLSDVWDEAHLLELIAQLAAQIQVAEIDEEFDSHEAALSDWVSHRRAALNTALAEGLPPGVPEPFSCSVGTK